MKRKAQRLLSCFLALCLILMSTPFPSLAEDSPSDLNVTQTPDDDYVTMQVGDRQLFFVTASNSTFEWSPNPDWNPLPPQIKLSYANSQKSGLNVEAVSAGTCSISVVVTPKDKTKEPVTITWEIEVEEPEPVDGTKITITNSSTVDANIGKDEDNPLRIYENDRFTLRADITDDDDNLATDRRVSWSQDPRLLTMEGASPYTSVDFIAPTLTDDDSSPIITITAKSIGYSLEESYFVQILKRPTLSLKYEPTREALDDRNINLGKGHSFSFEIATNRSDDSSISVLTQKSGIISVDVDKANRTVTVTADAEGEDSVIVSVENVSRSFKVNVYTPADTLELSDDDQKLINEDGIIRLEAPNGRLSLKPKRIPADADITFAPRSDSGSVSVTTDGRVTPKVAGLCTVIVESKKDTLEGTDGAGYPDPIEYTIEVVNTATGISLAEPKTRSIAVGGYVDVTAEARGASNAAEKKIEWSVSGQDEDDPIVMTEPGPNAELSEDDKDYDPNALRITGMKPGTVTVTATTANEIRDSYTITVAEPVTAIEIVAKDDDKPAITDGSAEVFVGDRFQLAVAFTPDTVTAPIKWESSSTGIASVENGLLSAKHTGNVTIKATVPTIDGKGSPQEKTCTLDVTVKPIRVSEVTMDGLDKKDGSFVATVGLDSKLSLRDYLRVLPSNASNLSVTWKSSDESVAPVKNGVVTPLKVGTAIITATSDDDNSKSVSIVVTVTASSPTGILLNPNDPVTLEINQSQTFTAVLTPSGSDGTVTFGKTGNDILDHRWTQNKIFTVTGRKPGEATVAVKLGNLNTSVKVTVSGVVIDDSRIVNNSLSVATGTSTSVSKKLYGSAKTVNAKDWVWSSDNETVVRVNESSGLITGIKPGTAKVTCKNKGYTAEITVNVSESSATVLSYKMTDEKLYSFATKIISDIRNQCKTAFEGSDLDYVTNLSVAPSHGTLYYGYVSETNPGQGVASSDKFYYKVSATATSRLTDVIRYATGKPLDKLLSDVTFIPATGFSGKADISYTAFAENGKDLAGSIQITVPVASELTYDSPNGEAVRFITNDFSTLSQATTGYPISSVRFNVPSERYGYLYYEYAGGEVYGSNITSGQRFYASSTPSLDSVSFVPRAGYTGTFPLTFTGWNTNGVTFTGTVRITVKSSGEGGGDISYSTISGSRVYFDAIDFQNLCRSATGGKLNYVQFTALPSTVDSNSSSSSSAVLYHGSGSGSRVSTSSSLYASSSGSRWTLDNVYLLPSSSFTGSVTIPFKGWDTDRKSFEGTVVVTVTKDGGTAATIYMTCTGMPLVFRRADFDDACKDALPALLKSVRFQIPGSNSGTLYSRFNDLNDRQPLAANQDIPAADLVTLSYLPKGESSGTVYLSYTATDEKDNICTGQIRITIDPNTVSQYFIDLDNTIWAIPSINFLRSYGVVTGKGKKRYQPNNTLKRGDFVLMLARAFDFSLSGTESFPDVPQDSYYAGAIAAGKSLNLIKGSGKNGSFRPEDQITRQEAATILFRVLQTERNLSAADIGYLTAYSDMGQIEPYAQTALATLVRDGIFEGSGGRLYPYAPLTRAQMAVILHRAIT